MGVPFPESGTLGCQGGIWASSLFEGDDPTLTAPVLSGSSLRDSLDGAPAGYLPVLWAMTGAPEPAMIQQC